MAQFLIVRLRPETPVTGDDFTQYLRNPGGDLTIEVLDVSFAKLNPKAPPDPLLGSATYNPDDPDANRIFQHRAGVDVAPPPAAPPPPPAPLTKTVPMAIATAAVEITSPVPEFGTPDIALRVKRGTKVIATFPVTYNVAVATTTLPPPPPPPDPVTGHNPDPLDPLGRTVHFQSDDLPVAALVPLVAPALEPDLGDASVTLPRDGSPPNYLDLKNAVKQVMRSDPGGIAEADLEDRISRLTPAQARHVAFEIASQSSLAPLTTLTAETLERFYTLGVGNDTNDDNDRQQFEGKLLQYQGELNATGEVLAKYVYSLAAALTAERLSREATTAGLQFPMRPAAPPAAGKIAESLVALRNT
jgi:hypothetical protein